MDAPTATQASSSSSSSSSSPALPAVPGDARYRWLFASALVVLVSTVLAFRQPPNPDPFATPRWTDANFWRYPVEHNAYKRLPLLRGITAMAVAPEQARYVVAAIDKQLLYSDDGGSSWHAAAIDWRGAPAAATAPRAAAGNFPQLFAAAWAGEMPQEQRPEQFNSERSSSEQSSPEQFSKQPYGDAAKGSGYLDTPPVDANSVDKKIDAVREQKVIPVQQQSFPSTKNARIDVIQKSPVPLARPPFKSNAKPAPITPPIVPARPARTDGGSEPIIALQVLANGQGYALGSFGLVLRSTDYGKTWQARGVVPGPNPLQAVITAIDAEHAWCVDTQENIYVTTDGGVRWQSLGAGYNYAIDTMQFVDTQRGWLHTVIGSVLRSDDGGRSWRELKMAAPTRSVQFFDRDTGWALTEKGALMATRDGGESWQLISAPKFRNFHFFDTRHGWGLTAKGVLHNTDDGGANWQPWSQGDATSTKSSAAQFSELAVLQRGVPLFNSDSVAPGMLPIDQNTLLLEGYNWIKTAHRDQSHWLPITRPIFGAVDNISGLGACQATGLGELLCSADYRQWQLYPGTATGGGINIFKFVDARTGWIGTREGRLLITRDAGRQWQPIREAPTGLVSAIEFSDPTRGWLVSSTGVYRTSDAGDSWQLQRQLCGDCYARVKFVSAKVGWLFGAHHVARTADGGQSWQVSNVPAGVTLRSAAFVDADVGWLVGEGGVVLHSIDGGAKWKTQISGVTTTLNDVAFLDPQTGWAIGDGGLVLSTKNGGDTWTSLKKRSVDTLRTIAFRDSNHGAIFGSGGPALFTEDGGKQWQVVLYRREPPRWYYLGLGAALALLLPALRRPDPERRVAESIANLLASDAPLQPGDPDPLSFGLIARTLSAFIRNRNTTPPLTIAVCGRWGSGKSSLMNLLRSDLKKYGFPGVWFNAWHHQKEEHLLASLLAAIRHQGVPKLLQLRPPFINPDWVSFRYGLLVQRGPNYWLTALFVLFVAALSAAFVAANPSTVDQRLTELLRLLPWINQSEHPGSAAAESRPWKVLWDSRDLFGLATSLSLAAAGIFKVLRAFGVSPGKLLQDTGPNQGAKDLDSRLDFRHYFAREFREVTAALHPQRMVIFIDDLDRCRHEHVLEVLEAINFLVSSGDCIVVLGMDYQVVQQSVMLEYRDLAQQIAASEGGDGARAERFAEEYLEKLINVQVAVPSLEPGESAHLLVPEPDEPTAWQIYCAQLHGIARVLSPVLLVLAAILLGVVGGQILVEHTQPLAINGVNTTSSNPPVVVAAAPIVTTPNPATPSATTPLKETSTEKSPALFASEAQILPQWDRYVVIPILLLGMALAVVVLRRRDVITDDSDTFREALQIWSGVVQLHRNTPRAVKRYLNRARYLAMRLRQQRGEDPGGWRSWIPRRPKEVPATLLDEQCLVAISALHHVDPAWLHPDTAADRLPAPVIEAIARHRAVFGMWPPPTTQLEQFHVLVRGIRV